MREILSRIRSKGFNEIVLASIRNYLESEVLSEGNISYEVCHDLNYAHKGGASGFGFFHDAGIIEFKVLGGQDKDKCPVQYLKFISVVFNVQHRDISESKVVAFYQKIFKYLFENRIKAGSNK